jgi:D-glycero-D-manno-heptose 1,7-bisphosphate phosphatase
MKPRRFALLDRDGTLNAEKCYLASPDELELLPGTAAGLRHLARLGLGLVVVTNQSGVGRGYFQQSVVDAVHVRLRELLQQEGVILDGIFVCPHTGEDGCDCRKPKPGLALLAAEQLGFDSATAFVIGDKACDVELGRAIGATTILVRTGYGAQTEANGQTKADFVVGDLQEAAREIERVLVMTTEKEQPCRSGPANA